MPKAFASAADPFLRTYVRIPPAGLMPMGNVSRRFHQSTWRSFATGGRNPQTWADMETGGSYEKTWSDLES